MVACLIVGIVGSPALSSAPTRNRGYWILGANAQVFAFGDAQLYAAERRSIRGQIEDMAAHPGGKGYWLLGRDGAVYAYGSAQNLGQPSFREQNAAAIASTPSGNGYYVVSEQGEVRAFGDAVTRGSVARRDLQRKIVDMAITPSGNGYWLVDASGRVFAFGDATSFGSVPRGGDRSDARSSSDDDRGAREDIVAIGAASGGTGYWIATAAGDVFAFGAAAHFAPLADPSRGRDDEDGERTNKKIVDLTTTWTGLGYWLVDRDGLVFAFGDAVSYGQLGRRDLRSGQVVAIVSTPFVNHDPVAVSDSASLDEDTTVDVNVLGNDTDEDGDPLTAAVLTQPAHGSATLRGDGTIRYAPGQDYNGTDSFTYRVTDGFGGAATGTVALTIRPVNDAPVAADDAFTIDEDTVLADSLTANDTDVDHDVLTAHLAQGPAHGAVVLGATGSFTYTPNPNYNGDDSFSYRAFDGALESALATVRVHVNPVNDPPVGTTDAATVNEDELLSVGPAGVLTNDSDVENDPLTAILVTGTGHGTLALAADGSYTYKPAPDYNGSDSFTYRASDGLLTSGDTTVAITIVPVNDAPVASPDSWEGLEDWAVVVAAPGPLGNDTDVDLDPLTMNVVTSTSHGTLTAQSDGSFSYVPSANFNGDDSFTYVARDAFLASAPVTVTIHVVAVPDPPIALPDTYEGTEDQDIVVDAPGVLANDSDVDSPAVTARLVTPPANGKLVFAPDGSFTYTPKGNFNGVDTFVYHASDGALESGDTEVTLLVAAVNDAPVAVPDAYTIDEDTILFADAPGVMANDTDVDGDALQVRLATPPEHGDLTLRADGSFEYVPAANYNGSDGFTYDLGDGTVVVTTTVTITINPVNDPPTANDDSYTARVGTTLSIAAPGVLTNDFDDSGSITAVLVTGPASGTLVLNADGSFTYTTSLTAAGNDSFTYKVTDGTTDSLPATVHLAVLASTSGGGGTGSFGGFTTASQAIYDVDELNLHTSGTIDIAPKLGSIVTKYGSAWYVPSRGARGHDSFTVGGRHFEVDVLSDIWGD